MRLIMKILLKHKTIRIISAILLAIILIVIYMNQLIERPTAEKGVLNLANWDFTHDGFVNLNGDWEFCWRKLINNEDINGINEREKKYVPVPDTWNYYKINGKALERQGFATYRIRVKVREPNQSYSLKILNMSSAYTLIVDGQILASNGKVGTSEQTAKSDYKPITVTFKPISNTINIVVQVSNFTYYRGGIWRPIYLGYTSQIEQLNNSIMIQYLLIIGSASTVFLLFLFYYMERRDSVLLYLSLLSIIILLYLAINESGYLKMDLIPISYNTKVFLYCMVYYWSMIAGEKIIYALYPQESSPTIIKIHLWLTVLFSVVAFVAPTRVYTYFGQFFDYVFLSAGISVLVFIIKAVINKREGAVHILLSMIVALMTMMHDILMDDNIITDRIGSISQWGYLIIILSLSLMISKRIQKTFIKAEALSKELIIKDKEKDEFLTSISHELKTPINSIIAIMESFINDSEASMSQKQKETLSLVPASGKRLAGLIDELLDFSKMRDGDPLLQKSSFHLESFIHMLVREFELIAKNNALTLETQIQSNRNLYADKYRILQVLYNLLGNAVKFTPAGGKITINVFEDERHIYISVSDTGIGIPQDKLKKIFRPFEQASVGITRKYGGLGLGLSISQKIAHAHQGNIRVESIEGVGSNFILSLPIVEEPLHVCSEKNENTYVNKSESEQIRMNIPSGSNRLTIKGEVEQTIIIIDDDYANIEGIAGILKLEGYHIIGFTNANEGLHELMANKNIILAIVDLMMPDISGYDICHKIRERYSLFELPILILTARIQVDSMVQSFKEGANDILHKPFDVDELRARVNTLCQLKLLTETEMRNEMAMLQAQINPHFLNNALNTIAAFCYEDSHAAADAIITLSKYLMYSFDFDINVQEIPLAQEMDLVETYLSIEKMRFNERLDYIIELSDEAGVSIPLFTVQPIVENAVRHGINRKEEGGTVWITGKQEHDQYIICIKDDGIGIRNEDLKKIYAGQMAHQTGVGMKNVRQRLKRLYGTDLTITSQYQKGTTVMIKIKI